MTNLRQFFCGFFHLHNYQPVCVNFKHDRLIDLCYSCGKKRIRLKEEIQNKV